MVNPVDGEVVLSRTGGRESLREGSTRCPGDQISTGPGGGSDIRFDDKGSVVNILSNSTVVIPVSEDVDISLGNGLMRFISSVAGAFRIRTPHSDAVIDGTEAMVAVEGADQDTLVLVREGVVTVIDRRDPGLPLRCHLVQARQAKTPPPSR